MPEFNSRTSGTEFCVDRHTSEIGFVTLRLCFDDLYGAAAYYRQQLPIDLYALFSEDRAGIFSDRLESACRKGEDGRPRTGEAYAQ